MKIEETPNSGALKLVPVKEKMDLFIPKITIENAPNRNGFVSLFIGAPGSGKSSLLLSMLGNKACYKGKFKYIFYFCPLASYLSVKDHPLDDDATVIRFHDLTAEHLDAVHDYMVAMKNLNEEQDNPKEYHCLMVIDDFANDLKDSDIEKALKRILVKSRHLMLATIITLQGYLMLPRVLRKLMTNGIIFKPQNRLEWDSLVEEHLSHLEKKEAKQLYDYCFSEPYNHLDVNTKQNAKEMFARNFNSLTLG